MTFIAWDDDNNGIPHGVGGFFADPRTVFVAPATGEYTLGVHDFIPAGAPPEFEVHIDGVIPCTLFKDIVDGNDVDGDGAIDKVVEVGIESAAEYSFSINYNNPDGPTVVILDTVPAEWWVNNILEGGVLYFSEDLNDGGLWILDTTTGAAYAVGISGVTGQTVGLALSDSPGTLWGSKPFDMLAISKDGSGAAVIGNAVAEGLTYNPDNGKLYGAINGDFFEVSTGDFTTLTPLADPGNDIEGLAYAGDGLIYGLSSFSGPRGYLYSYDIGSDTWTEIGFTGVEFSEAGLAYDAASDLLYAKGDQDSILYAINPSDATATPIGDTGIAEGGGLTFDGAGLNCEFEQANKGKKDDKSATKITCWPAADSGSVVVDVEARCHGNRNNEKCRPTSCGALYLNDGAEAYELDEYGDPIYPPIAVSNALCLAAVEDVNEDGVIDYTGAGDEDGDGLSDFGEACEIGTDPCVADTDGDGVPDGEDACPLDGDEGLGVDASGCPIRSCTMIDNYAFTWTLLLEGDGTIAPGSTVDPSTWDTLADAAGVFNPEGAVDMEAINTDPDGCVAETDTFVYLGACAAGTCGGTWQNYCSGAPVAGSGSWTGTTDGICELSNPDAAPPAPVAPLPAVPDSGLSPGQLQ